MQTFIYELKQLTQTPSISGYEWELGITDKIQNLMGFQGKKIGDNLVYTFGSGKRKLLLSAHMDEVGIMLTNIKPDGSNFVPIGDIPGSEFCEKEFEIFDKNAKKQYFVLSKSGAFILKSKVISSQMAGSVGTFRKIFRFSDMSIYSAGLDNKVGCLALIHLGRYLTRNQSTCQIIICFSTREEIGLNGLMSAVRIIQPDLCIDVDSAYANGGNLPSSWLVPTIGNGPALQLIGTDFVLQSSKRRFVEYIANENNIQLQYEIPSSESGGTNAKSLSNAGYESIQLNIPVAKQHTAESEASVNDIKKMIDLLVQIVKNF